MAVNNRYRQKSALPFGEYILPVIGVVFLAVLILSIRIFFLPKEDRPQPISRIDQTPPLPPIVQPTPDYTTPTNIITTPINVARPTSEEPNTTTATTPQIDPDSQTVRPSGTATTTPTATPSSTPTTTPPVTTTTPATDYSVSGSTYVVQIGSFNDNASAQRELTNVKNKGFDAIVRQGTVNGRTVYRVVVAGGPSKTTADTVGEKLKELNFPTWVVKK